MNTFDQHDRYIRSRIRRLTRALFANTGKMKIIDIRTGHDSITTCRGFVFGHWKDFTEDGNHRIRKEIEKFLGHGAFLVVDPQQQPIPCEVHPYPLFQYSSGIKMRPASGKEVYAFSVMAFPSWREASMFRLGPSEIQFIAPTPDAPK